MTGDGRRRPVLPFPHPPDAPGASGPHGHYYPDEGTEDPAKAAREADRAKRVASLLAANRRGRPADPDGMGGDTWKAWP